MFCGDLWTLCQLAQVYGFSQMDTRGFGESEIAIAAARNSCVAKELSQLIFALVLGGNLAVAILRQHSQIKAQLAQSLIGIINSQFEPLLGARGEHAIWLVDALGD